MSRRNRYKISLKYDTFACVHTLHITPCILYTIDLRIKNIYLLLNIIILNVFSL